jgi:hypothetical protein
LNKNENTKILEENILGLENNVNFPREFSLNFNKFDKDFDINFVKQTFHSVNPVSSGSPDVYVVHDTLSEPLIHEPKQSRVYLFVFLI